MQRFKKVEEWLAACKAAGAETTAVRAGVAGSDRQAGYSAIRKGDGVVGEWRNKASLGYLLDNGESFHTGEGTDPRWVEPQQLK